MGLNVGIIGVGEFGRAMIQPWLCSTSLIDELFAVNPTDIKEKFKGESFTSDKKLRAFISTQAMLDALNEERKQLDFLFLTTKQPQLAEIASDLKGALTKSTAIVSLMAGVELENLQQHLGQNKSLVRAMSTLAAELGKALTFATANQLTSPEQQEKLTHIFKNNGSVHWVPEEDHNALTYSAGGFIAAIAYIAHMMAKQTAGKTSFSNEEAELIMRETIMSAASLFEHDPQSLLKIASHLTTPGGVTEAGTSVINDGRIFGILKEALQAAISKGVELGGNTGLDLESPTSPGEGNH